MLTNPFNCPPPVFRSMDRATPVDMPALWAVCTLGPGRVQYVGRPRNTACQSNNDTPTSWSLDGKPHVTVGELIGAAEAVAYPVAA